MIESVKASSSSKTKSLVMYSFKVSVVQICYQLKNGQHQDFFCSAKAEYKLTIRLVLIFGILNLDIIKHH